MYHYAAVNLITAPTAVRDLSVTASSPESIFISWSHPNYPNGPLTQYTVYYTANLQMKRSVSTDGFDLVIVPGNMTSLNLTGLEAFTMYTILISASGEGVKDSFAESEVITRTNTTGKLCCTCSHLYHSCVIYTDWDRKIATYVYIC